VTGQDANETKQRAMTLHSDDSVLTPLWSALESRAVQPEWLLSAVCERACRRLGVHGAAIVLHMHSGAHDLVARAGSGAVEADEAQFVAGEGPAITARTLAAPVLVSDLRADPATPWPGFIELATEAKIAAMFSFPLLSSARRLGTLDLHRRDPGPLTAVQIAEAELLARLAAATVAVFGDRLARRAEAGEGHYQRVHRAIDMLADQLDESTTEAAARLRSHAFSHGLSPRTVAEAVLTHHLNLDTSGR
jgi:transcriptional regulator with GAF, ATPase, and Fis domain